MTSDGQVVPAAGGWQEGILVSIPTRDAFLAAPLLERYTPMSFRDLLLLMEEYPDICIDGRQIVTARRHLNDAEKFCISLTVWSFRSIAR